ncbi:NF038122 family metalloprotease [Paucibacter sp. TC2R-5]|uniref:M10 family metallopeptidase domain-containing protein n=1 Tax=Paucibacter sp. TC2R-5 TaxID=2893555 RepID=UPI0021E4DFBB|nr:M10 family metallopeptidase domain-containing protein [Paucibacter sp. TC2R-5]MCV2360717.1 NF038122 family metalloprotease [Paucibacter sp. TC2R-5]
MKKTHFLNLVAAAAAAACVLPAGAANIVLIDSSNSFSSSPNGAAALFAFQKAANYWNQTLTNNVTVNIEIGFKALNPGVLGQAGSESRVVSTADVYAGLAATGTTALDAIAVANLSKLNAGGGVSMRTNQFYDVANKIGVADNITTLRSGNLNINNYLDVNQSVIKALGLTSKVAPLSKYDASITFSNQFAFDFDPTNGVTAGSYDFTSVAVHELGHALGFVSGVDTFDLVTHGKGPYASAFENGDFGTKNITDWAIGSTLDLFRYGNALDPDGKHATLQWSANRAAFFSVDGNNVFSIGDASNQEAATFSTGRYTGDGQQASHWKDNVAFVDPDSGGACIQSTRAIGIMDPTMSPCTAGSVSRNDIAAFDALGWNTNIDALADKAYSVDTAAIYKMSGLAMAVPEPSTYAQLGLGLMLLAASLRARRRQG